jgi:hypothetical protein
MGGVGKSQMAIEYAYAHAGKYEAVWWINAEVPALIPEQMARLANRLGVEPRSGEAAAIREALHDALAGAAGWLLIFDNAESAEVVREWMRRVPLGPGIPGHHLVTTRREGFDTLGSVVELDVMDAAESVLLLRTRVSAIDEALAREIAEELGRLPLALEQAAAYLTKTRTPPAEYLRLLRTRTSDMLRRGTIAGRQDTIATYRDAATLLRRHPPEQPRPGVAGSGGTGGGSAGGRAPESLRSRLKQNPVGEGSGDG